MISKQVSISSFIQSLSATVSLTQLDKNIKEEKEIQLEFYIMALFISIKKLNKIEPIRLDLKDGFT